MSNSASNKAELWNSSSCFRGSLSVGCLFLSYVTDTAGVSGGAVSGQAGCSPIWTGSQFVCVVSGQSGLLRRPEGHSVRLPCCHSALQASQTKQRIAVWRCKDRLFPLALFELQKEAWLLQFYQSCSVLFKSRRIISVSWRVRWATLRVSCLSVCDYGCRKLRNFRESTEKRLCFPILKDFWERRALKPQRKAETRLGKHT